MIFVRRATQVTENGDSAGVDWRCKCNEQILLCWNSWVHVDMRPVDRHCGDFVVVEVVRTFRWIMDISPYQIGCQLDTSICRSIIMLSMLVDAYHSRVKFKVTSASGGWSTRVVLLDLVGKTPAYSSSNTRDGLCHAVDIHGQTRGGQGWGVVGLMDWAFVNILSCFDVIVEVK